MNFFDIFIISLEDSSNRDAIEYKVSPYDADSEEFTFTFEAVDPNTIVSTKRVGLGLSEFNKEEKLAIEFEKLQLSMKAFDEGKDRINKI